MKEKRGAPRVKEQFPVRISTAGRTYHGRSCDVSLNGLACTSPIPLPVSTPVRINLILPEVRVRASRADVICQAQVVRLERPQSPGREKDYRLAFNFGGMSKRARQKLEKFISQRLGVTASLGGGVVTEANVSHNGITCKSSTFIPPFREVEVSVIFPRPGSGKSQQNSIQFSGVVVSCEPEEDGPGYDVDLFFTDIDAKDRLYLRRYFKENRDYPA